MVFQSILNQFQRVIAIHINPAFRFFLPDRSMVFTNHYKAAGGYLASIDPIRVGPLISVTLVIHGEHPHLGNLPVPVGGDVLQRQAEIAGLTGR